jgi:hypothetical protein
MTIEKIEAKIKIVKIHSITSACDWCVEVDGVFQPVCLFALVTLLKPHHWSHGYEHQAETQKMILPVTRDNIEFFEEGFDYCSVDKFDDNFSLVERSEIQS